MNRFYFILILFIFLFSQQGIALVTKAKGSIEYKRNEDNKSFNITINAINDPPNVVSILDQNTLEEQTLDIELNASDIDGDTNISYTASIANSSLADISISSNVLTLVPIENQYGTTQVTIIASDGILSSSESTSNFTELVSKSILSSTAFNICL